MRKYLYTTLIVLTAFSAEAQFRLGMHQFTGVPQSNYTNPAIMPQARFYIGLPSIYVNYFNPTFVLDDIIQEVGDTATRLDFSKLYNEQPGGTFGFNIEEQAELFQIGFRIKKKTFISLGAYQSLQTNIRLPMDLLRFVQEGSTSTYFQNNPVSLNNIDIGIQSYVAYHIGFAREINKKWSVGGRVKFLNGLIGTQTEYARGAIRMNQDSILISSSLKYNMAGFATLDQSLGLLGEGGGTGFQLNDWFPASGNNGLAFDFGVTYKPIPKLTLSFSGTDLGSITWKEKLSSFVSDENEFVYKPPVITVGEEGGADPFEGIVDTLLAGFNIQEGPGSAFTTQLNSRFILSGSYDLLPNTQLGAIYSQNRFNDVMYPAFTAFAQTKVWNLLFLRANYTLSANTFDNLGGALAIKLGPVQVYTVADNLMALNNQGNVSSLNFRLGFNLLFGMRKPKEKKDVLNVEL